MALAGSSEETPPFHGRVVDSWLDPFRGVVVLCAVHSGRVRPGRKVAMGSVVCEAVECGIFLPAPRPLPAGLEAGQVGYLVTTMKAPSDAATGGVIHDHPMPEGYHLAEDGDAEALGRAPKAMVCASVYPVDSGKFDEVRANVTRLALNDSGVSIHAESSDALGLGLRLGFLGMLHMEVFLQRLQDEHNTPVITTAPSVPVHVVLKEARGESAAGGARLLVDRPSDMPDPKDILECFQEMVEVTIVMPEKYMGPVLNELLSRDGEARDTSYVDQDTVALRYAVPWQEVVTDFYDVIKSLTSGYASFDYEPVEPRRADLVKVEMLLNKEPVDALAFVSTREKATERAKRLAKRLKETIHRQQFEIIIQGAVGSKVSVEAPPLGLTNRSYEQPCTALHDHATTLGSRLNAVPLAMRILDL
eukprot:g5231.t1